jgi:iron complex outermembrane receptor protein
MKLFLTTFAALLFSLLSYSQQSLEIIVLDSLSQEPIEDAKVVVKNIGKGAFTDSEGTAFIDDIPSGTYNIAISVYGFHSKELKNIPIPNESAIQVLMTPLEQEFEEVVIEATRSNRSVADLPTRTEVLTDEIDEAASMEPSKISHLISHSTGIQVQTTAASSNGAVVRIQGLNGRYTQMLKDGFPLYGGFSGSLDILQIPPLDLRQVEYVKGPASTLYGGGAIAGLINLLTKKPEVDETLLHLNISHIGAKDFNAFASRKFGKFGFTNLATMHLHRAYDADNDGYSDVPEISKFNFNPKLFFNPDNKSEIYLGATVSVENRMGGDIDLINNEAFSNTNFYYDRQESNRFTSQFSADRKFNTSSTLTLKNSVSSFNRHIKIQEDTLGTLTEFAGRQLNSYSELNYNLNKEKHVLNAGLNFYTDAFTEQKLDSNELRNQSYLTYGGYVNYLWDVTGKLALETGLRGDYVFAKTEQNENNGEAFILPRLSTLYKFNRHFSIRLGGGLGYRMPTIFNEEAEPFGYKNIQPIDFENVKAERSYGGNIDFKYKSTLGTDNLVLSFNQMFFYNLIDNPILLTADSTSLLTYSNQGDHLYSQGFESQLKLTFWDFTLFVGYTYTDAFLKNGISEDRLTLTPQHSIKGDLLYVVENKWRIGWDFEYKSEQLIGNAIRTRSLFTTGVILERTIKNFVIFLNAENFTDTRQTRYEDILTGPNNTPQFTEVWAPLDGFFFNAGLKIKL